MAHSPTNRAQDILRRVEEHHGQPETIKTCFGILAIMSRDDSHKVLIAVDGMERILNAMMVNIDRPDVQEAGCDLLWSLAFNSAKVKEIIGKYGGTTVLVRGLKRHAKSADFLKSACGALSNLCQSKMNQHGFSSHGGIQPLVGAINFHSQNAKLLPFIFDALASLIVGNEENAKMMSTQDGVTLVLSTLAKMKTNTDVVKSGCHALAILSDVKGQANKIALGGGVVIILSLLDLHPSYADFHRVAAVVLLRMLQETPAIAREITSNEGVRILLKSLDKGGALEDTVAAVTHILSSITSPLNANSSMIESQLWISAADAAASIDPTVSGKSGKRGVAPSRPSDPSPSLDWHISSKSIQSLNAPQPTPAPQVSALGGLVRALETYCQRRDVVRAGCRLLSHVIGFAGVVMALDGLNIMDRIFECVSVHSETKDVLESTASLLKAIHRRTSPAFSGSKPAVLKGVLIVLRYKITDDDIVTACMELLARYHAIQYGADKPTGGSSLRHSGDKNSSGPAILSQLLEPWEHDCLGLCFKVLETLLGTDHNAIDLTTGLIKCLSQQRKSMSSSSTKSTKMLNSVLNVIEKIATANRGVMNAGPFENQPQLNVALSRALHTVSDTLTPKYSDIIRKIEALLPAITNRCERPGSGTAHRSLLLSSTGSVMGLKAGRVSGELPSSGHPPLRPSSSNTGPVVSSLNTALVGSNASERGGSRPTSLDSGRRASTGTALTANPLAGETPPHSARMGGVVRSRSGSRELTLPENRGMDQIESTNSIGQLLINWPFYLEKIIMNPAPSVNRSLDDLLDSSAQRMHVVYQCKSAAGLNVPSRFPISLPYPVPPGGVGAPFDHSIQFNSEFECGNIQCAIQRGERVYDLCLRPDLHTPGHTQWFYFAVSNIHNPTVTGRANLGLPVNKHVTIQFNIINFTKPDSSFNSGMKPVFYSMHDASTKGIGWVRHGSDISYTANDYQRLNAAGEGVESYFTLTFSMEFHNIEDTCLIAYSYPYSYTDCCLHVDSLLAIPKANDIIRRHRLCQTLSGKNCDLLIITDFTDRENIGPLGSSASPVPNVLPAFDQLLDQLKPSAATGKLPKRNRNPFKRGIVISARVHPGETPASWVMRGALDYLVSDTPGARMLRHNYVFFVVPMLNPDGVIFGNNRCSLAGVDLNRQWKIPMKQQHPTVYHLKTLMLEQKSFRDIVMYIDIHGHSRKYNVFLYGCDDKKKPTPKARDFPRIFSQHDTGKKYVSLDDCSFHVKKSREATARVVACRDLNIPMSYTIEATFCGPDSGPLKFYHMNIGHLLDCGGAMCDSILQYTFQDGQFPEGSVLPDPFRGLTRIDQNSYVNPEERHKMKGPVCISVEAAKALLASGSQLLRTVDGQSSSRVGEEAFETAAKRASAVGFGSKYPDETPVISRSESPLDDRKKGDAAAATSPSPAASFDDEDAVEKEPFVADDVHDNGDSFLSGSSDEDEEPDGMAGEQFEEGESVAGGDSRLDSGDIDDYDSLIEAEGDDGLDGENGDSESVITDMNRNSDELRPSSAPPVEEEGSGRRNINSSPIATKGAKTRTNLRSLIDDKDYNIAGTIASQRISDGIAMLPRSENSTATLDNIFKPEPLTGSRFPAAGQASPPPVGLRTKRISRKSVRYRRQREKNQMATSEEDSDIDIMKDAIILGKATKLEGKDDSVSVNATKKKKKKQSLSSL